MAKHLETDTIGTFVKVKYVLHYEKTISEKKIKYSFNKTVNKKKTRKL